MANTPMPGLPLAAPPMTGAPITCPVMPQPMPAPIGLPTAGIPMAPVPSPFVGNSATADAMAWAAKYSGPGESLTNSANLFMAFSRGQTNVFPS